MATLHACALILNNQGVVIFGAAGAGKSSLLLELLKNFNGFSCLIADDRLSLENVHGSLIATAAPALHGLIEVRGMGVFKMPFLHKACIDVVVELVETAQPRMIAPQFDIIAGISVPKYTLSSELSPQEKARLLTFALFGASASV
jgi:HPr kinase/phosphorylase